jgi:hypothetical protein
MEPGGSLFEPFSEPFSGPFSGPFSEQFAEQFSKFFSEQSPDGSHSENRPYQTEEGEVRENEAGEDEDSFLHFEFPETECGDRDFGDRDFGDRDFGDRNFDDFLFGDPSDENEEDPCTDLSEEEEGTWGFTGKWDADWGSFLSEELFSCFAEEELEEAEFEDSEDSEDASENSHLGQNQEKGQELSEAQYWERFVKNPEFLDSREARKFSLLPPIRHSEFHNLDWSYLQSRLFPKGGISE